MNTYLIKENRIYFKTAYNQNFIDDVKKVVGRIWDPDTKCWDCPINYSTISDINKLIEVYHIENKENNGDLPLSNTLISTDIETQIERMQTRYSEKILNLHLPTEIKLRNYQLKGLVYMLLSKRTFNCSDMGTGKTYTTIFSVECDNLFPSFVVVPASVKYLWERQWKKVNPNRTISVIENKFSNFEADVLILTYKSVGIRETIIEKGEEKEKIYLKYKQLESIKFKSLICDESQALKNPKTISSKVLKKISRKVDYIFFLTGTPIMNRPEEIINPLSILRQFDSMFPSWKDFVYRYCGAVQTRFGMDISGATNTLELNQKLRKTCYFRVEKREALPELPEREETILEVKTDNMKEYKQAEENLVFYIQENFGQLAANSALVAEQLVMISTLSQLATKGKMYALYEWIDNFLESSTEKLVVFGIHKEFLNLLSEKYKCDLITGDVDTKRRQKIVDEFQVNSKRLLFLNILTGGVGIDGLQNICSNVLIYELPWRPTDIEQAVSRLERDGQKNNTNIYFMLGIDTIDIKRWKLLLDKTLVTDAVNKGEDVTLQKYLSTLMKSYL